MFSRRLISFCFFLAVSALNAQPLIAPPQQWTLGNGLQVAGFSFGKIAAVNITLYVNTGQKNETPSQQALSQLVASSLAYGTADFSRDSLELELFKIGATLGTSTNPTYSSVSFNCPTGHIERGIELLASIIERPKFPEADLLAEKQNLADNNNPSRMNINSMVRVFGNFWLYGANHPLGRFFYKTQLEKITLQQMSDFYSFNYTPKNCRLTVAGDFNFNVLKAAVEKYFSPWTAPFGEVNGVNLPLPDIKAHHFAFIHKDSATQAAICWFKNAPQSSSKDLLPYLIANFAWNRLLFLDIREHAGKTYGINCIYNEEANENISRTLTQTRASEMLNTIRLFDTTLNKFFVNGISPAEFKTAVKSLQGDWIFTQSPAGISAFFNPLLYKFERRNNYLTEINAITIEMVNKVIKKYWSPDDYYCMIAGDQFRLQNQLSQLPELKKFIPKDIETDGQ